MQIRVWIKRAVCLLCAAALVAALTACGKNKKKASVQESNPYALSDPGELTSKGYELPYAYEDGYKAVVPAVDNSEFFTASKTPGGNMTFHLTTDKSVEEVQKFYDAYFAKLPKVKAKKTTDETTGYYDKDKRMIIFNFYVWTADGKTNYKMGAEACDKLEDSKFFEAVK